MNGYKKGRRIIVIFVANISFFSFMAFLGMKKIGLRLYILNDMLTKSVSWYLLNTIIY